MSRIVAIIVFLTACFSSCGTGDGNPNKDLTLDYFSGFRDSSLLADGGSIRACMEKMMRADGVRMPSDRFTRKYYRGGKPFLWISYEGVTASADTLLEYLGEAGRHGISPRLFRLEQIAEDLRTVRSLDVRDNPQPLSFILARLEYNLTRSYLRYISGQHFGFLNPNSLYNKLDTLSCDSTGIKWKRLCDLRVKRPDSAFFARSVACIGADSMGHYISELLPRGRLYGLLAERLASETLPESGRMKTLCNMERCRWRLDVMPGSTGKYVEVNIPSYNLRAVDGDSVLSMRVCCGAAKTKTPLLSSLLMRMDFNPQWIVPKSIASGYVGRSGYMRSQGMFVYDKKRGKLPPEEASYNAVMQGGQYIIQAGGPKNSLGRIIFRFENNFSVFLHDTSAPWHFMSRQRAVSHGCIRVECPYDLALFMLGDKKKALADRIRHTMTMDVEKDNGSRGGRSRIKAVNSVGIEPQIPLFITYYTLYYGSGGGIVPYDDIYKFDDVTIEQLRPYIYTKAWKRTATTL